MVTWVALTVGGFLSFLALWGLKTASEPDRASLPRAAVGWLVAIFLLSGTVACGALGHLLFHFLGGPGW